MKKKKALLMDKNHPDLLVEPHIVDELFHLVTGEWKPDPAQEEQLIAHFIECSFCRIALIELLFAEQKYENVSGDPETPVHRLIERFVTIHHEIEALEHEHLGAYAEAMIALGKAEANKRFPRLVEHMSKCPLCQLMLEKTLAFLNQSEAGENL